MQLLCILMSSSFFPYCKYKYLAFLLLVTSKTGDLHMQLYTDMDQTGQKVTSFSLMRTQLHGLLLKRAAYPSQNPLSQVVSCYFQCYRYSKNNPQQSSDILDHRSYIVLTLKLKILCQRTYMQSIFSIFFRPTHFESASFHGRLRRKQKIKCILFKSSTY